MSAKQPANENKKRAAEPTASEAKQTKAETKPKQDMPSPKIPPQKTSSPTTAKKNSNPKSGWLLGFLFLLVLLAAAATSALGWFGYQQLLSLQQELGKRPTHQELQAPLQGLNSLTSLKNRQGQLEQTASDHQLQLIDIQKTLINTSEPKPRDWQLAEVEYLLRLANQRLQLEEDVEGALTLLKTAQERLKKANVPGTLGVRSHLLEDIEELKALPKLDKVSMALNLQKLADKALSLKVQPLLDAPSLNLDAVTQSQDELNWYHSLWQEVRSLVIIRKRELPVEALPFAEDELALRHQLSALLLQASWAALRGEQQLYASSLEGANKRLAAFDVTQPEVEEFSKQLKALAEQPIRLKLPKSETSLDSLQAFIAQRYNLQLPIDIEDTAPAEEINQEEQP